MRLFASILNRIAVGCFAFYGTTGCNDRAAPHPSNTAPSVHESVSEKSIDKIGPTENEAGAGNRRNGVESETLLEDTWFAITIDGKKVGHRRVTRRTLERDNQTILKTTGREHIRLVREGREAVADFDCIALETEDGTFLEAEYRLPFGLNHGWTLAKVDGTTLRVGPKTGDGAEAATPWPLEAGGPFAIEKSLRARPMAPGETREQRFFDASLGQVITASLQAVDWESTELLGIKNRLLRIDGRMRLPNSAELKSTLWIDDRGIVWRESQIVGVTVVAYRTSKETALAPDDGQPLDLFRHVLLPVDPPIAAPHDRDRITYRITVSDADPTKLFVHDSRQRMQMRQPHEVRLVVGSGLVRSDDLENGPAQPIPARTEPTQSDCVSSPLAQSDDSSLQELALSVAAGESNAATIATALEAMVFERIEEKSYGKVFASAAEAAALREGDCTEHSVLLVALCRARGIPARAAMGLVYSEAHQAFAYHMWTEIWTGKSWLGLDATLGRGRIGPTHLKMANSSLEGPAALAEMAMILQAVGKLKIDVVDE